MREVRLERDVHEAQEREELVPPVVAVIDDKVLEALKELHQEKVEDTYRQTSVRSETPHVERTQQPEGSKAKAGFLRETHLCREASADANRAAEEETVRTSAVCTRGERSPIDGQPTFSVTLLLFSQANRTTLPYAGCGVFKTVEGAVSSRLAADLLLLLL